MLTSNGPVQSGDWRLSFPSLFSPGVSQGNGAVKHQGLLGVGRRRSGRRRTVQTEITESFELIPYIRNGFAQGRFTFGLDHFQGRGIEELLEIAFLSIRFRDGETKTHLFEEAIGMPNRPLSDADLVDKFNACLRFAGLPDEDVDLTRTDLAALAARVIGATGEPQT